MQKVCRLCLQTQQHDVTPLFRDNVDDDECRQLRLQIADLCSIIILQDDGFPKLICCNCKIKLQEAHEFVNLCKRSNDELLEHYEINKSCQIKEVISLKGKKQKPAKERKKCSSGSLRPTRKSLYAHTAKLIEVSEVNTFLTETYNATLCQGDFNENIEATKLETDDTDKSNIDPQETPLRKQLMQDPNVHSNELPENINKQYLCDVCSKTFASKSGLRFHLKSHYGFKPYICQYCGKSFALPSYKKRHERTHTGDKLICHICSTAFASSNGLKYHLRTHTGEANYHCNTCGKSFTRYKYLKEHIFMHTGEKPYVCKLCGSAYGASGSLFVHEKKCKTRQDLNFQKDATK